MEIEIIIWLWVHRFNPILYISSQILQPTGTPYHTFILWFKKTWIINMKQEVKIDDKLHAYQAIIL